MRTHLLILLLIAFTTSTYAQLNELFAEQKADLSNWEIPISNAEKQKFIKPLRALELFEWPFYNLDNCKEYLDNFHIVDFDLDGRKDILYHGLLGGESMYLVLMRNVNASFEKVLSVAGSLNFASEKTSLTPLTIGITQYGCCMEMVNQFELYHPIWNNGKYKYELALKYGFPYGTQFPEQTFDPVGFETINPEYKLRISPIIDDGPSKLEDNNFPGNLQGVYPEGSEGIAIAESQDNTGRTWWFVLMKNNLKPLSSIMNNGANNSNNYYTMGWISSRFVKKIE